MQRHRTQLAFERGELPTSPSSRKKGQEPQAPCEIARKFHSLNRVTFVVKNDITAAQCTCLDFGQCGVCPDSAAALELANLINLKALSESMQPVHSGRKAVPLPTVRQISRGVAAAAAGLVPPCAHFRAEPGLGAKAGAQRGATGKSGRCYIGARVGKVFNEAGRPPAILYGQVTRCRNSDGALLWKVRYDDSDQEELDENGVINAAALDERPLGYFAPFDHSELRLRLCGVLAWVEKHGENRTGTGESLTVFDEAARDLTPNDAYMAIDEKVIIILSWLLKRKIRVLLKRTSMGVDFCGESNASPDEAQMYGLPVDGSWLPPESSARAMLYLANRQAPPAHYDLVQLFAPKSNPGTSTGACPAAGDLHSRGGLHSRPAAGSSARPLGAAPAGYSTACGAAGTSSAQMAASRSATSATSLPPPAL